jgi:hypothetical protein
MEKALPTWRPAREILSAIFAQMNTPMLKISLRVD